MNTFWLKVAALTVVIIVVVVGVTMIISPKGGKPAEPAKTIYDTARQDRKELLAEPSAKDFTEGPDNSEPQRPEEPVVLYFKPLSEIEKIEAERLMQTVPSFRSIGRMPFTGYGTMVESCRQIIRRFSGSIYDYKARRALAQVPTQYWTRYKITAELIDLTPFTIQRQNTCPYNPQQQEDD